MGTKSKEPAGVYEGVEKLLLAASECPPGEHKRQLLDFAKRLEGIAGRSYFSTSRGERDIANFVEEVETIRASIAACGEEGPEKLYCETMAKEFEHLQDRVTTFEYH